MSISRFTGVTVVSIAAMALAAYRGQPPSGISDATGPAPAVIAAPAQGPDAELPAPAKELEPLTFMAGHWVFPTPNGRLINREHWMTPAGKSMVGAFQQLRRDGGVAFYEFSAIMAEPDAKDGPVVVTLYHRHMHPKLMIDDKRKNVDVFRLAATGPNSATFVPTVDIAGGIENMIYRLEGPDTLVQEIRFKPDSKEKTFSTAYAREK